MRRIEILAPSTIPIAAGTCLRKMPAGTPALLKPSRVRFRRLSGACADASEPEAPVAESWEAIERGARSHRAKPAEFVYRRGPKANPQQWHKRATDARRGQSRPA